MTVPSPEHADPERTDRTAMVAVIAVLVGSLLLSIVIATGIGLLWWTGREQAVAEPSPVPSPDVCGEPVFKPDGDRWRCTFADEFSGPELDRSIWSVQVTDISGFQVDQECFVDAPENIEVSDGTLKLTVREEPADYICSARDDVDPSRYTAASVFTGDDFGQAFGRFEIRARFPDVRVTGLQAALWLWPQDAMAYGPWPASGEIDIAEFFSRFPDRAIPHLHYHTSTPDATVTNQYCLLDDPAAFHSYVAEWTTTGITISYDGRPCLEHIWHPAAPLAAPAPFDRPFMIALTHTLGIEDNRFEPGTTPLPATAEIDYVRVWA